MFRCQICGQVAPAGMRASKIVVASRSRTYASVGSDRDNFRSNAPRGRQRFRRPKKEYDKGGHGTEIVQELMACASCAKTPTTHVVDLDNTATDGAQQTIE
jgi:hypothetical protein